MDILKQNFFELFNIEISVDINKSDLEYKLEFGDMDFCKLEPNFEKIMKESEHAK